MFDLGQRQPQPLPLPDKVEQTDHVLGIDPTTRRGAARYRQNAPRLIEPEGLVADAAALRNFSDPHGVDGKLGLTRVGSVACVVEFLRIA